MTTPQTLNAEQPEDSGVALTSHTDPQKIACDLPRYIDKVDFKISYHVSKGSPFKAEIPPGQLRSFHPCIIHSHPHGRTYLGREFLGTNGRLLIRGFLKLPPLKGVQLKAKNNNSLSTTERSALAELTQAGEQPSSVQMRILKHDLNQVVDAIVIGEPPYCPIGAVTFDISVALNAIESYIEIPYPADPSAMKRQISNAIRTVYGAKVYGVSNINDRADKDLEDYYDKWRIKLGKESVQIKVYPKEGYYRLEVRRTPKNIRMNNAASSMDAGAFWKAIDIVRAESELILKGITDSLSILATPPTLDVKELTDYLKADFKSVQDSRAFGNLIKDLATSGIYDPGEYKSDALTSHKRNRLVELGYCRKQHKNHEVKNGGRNFLVLNPDWKDRVAKARAEKVCAQQAETASAKLQLV